MTGHWSVAKADNGQRRGLQEINSTNTQVNYFNDYDFSRHNQNGKVFSLKENCVLDSQVNPPESKFIGRESVKETKNEEINDADVREDMEVADDPSPPKRRCINSIEKAQIQLVEESIKTKKLKIEVLKLKKLKLLQELKLSENK
ncbi:uncharacterized protein LOC111634247 [Centruroides sculpturatus]|uniref:uncharacterized protein LOC111634247 n=1 Tax=Centruroides sculpturatus TaxID=218467 RepID=UPI000C6D4F98|nr:uncharacterized protein LOC111634247 [Centruroides sculpturatus]